MKRILHLFIVVFMLLAVSIVAQRGQLKTPRAVGNVSGFDVSQIKLEFVYDPSTDEFELSGVDITALEGEVIGGAFQVHPGGFVYHIDVADLPADFVQTAKLMHRKALNDYGGKKGYPVVQ